jgi:hypothetical protein
VTKQVMEAILIKVLLCTYPNGCGVCSKVTVDTATKVLDVNWTHCVDRTPQTVSCIRIIRHAAKETLQFITTSMVRSNLQCFNIIDIFRQLSEKYEGLQQKFISSRKC